MRVAALLSMATLSLAAAGATPAAGTVATAAPVDPGTTRFIGDRPADLRALLAVSEAWVACFKSGDLDRLMSLYSDDAVIMSPNQPRIVGAAAIRASFTRLLQRPERDIVIHVEEIGVDGRHAWASVLGVIRYREDSGARREYASRTFLVYQRDRDGRWHILRDLDQPTPDAGFLKVPD